MKISYAVTVCNEYKEVEKLLSFLFENKRKEDEVVVQMDFDNSTTEVVKACEKWESKQSEEYKLNTIGPDSAFKVSIEAGITFGWEKYTGRNGLNIGVNRFGESAPGEVLAEYFGFTAEKIANKIKKAIS